jgi:putative FmdB family regulatory protein
MPTYEFECGDCNKIYEIFFKTIQDSLLKLDCPECRKPLIKLISMPQRAIVHGGTDRAIAFDRHHDTALNAMIDYNNRLEAGDVSSSEVMEAAEIEKEEMAKRGKPSGPRKPLRTKTDIDSFRAAGRKKVIENRRARSQSWF